PALCLKIFERFFPFFPLVHDEQQDGARKYRQRTWSLINTHTNISVRCTVFAQKGNDMAKQPRKLKGQTSMPRVIQPTEPIFGSQVSSVVPGELLVQLREDTAAQITESVPTGPTRGHSMPGPISLGVSAIDDILAELQTNSVVRLTPPLS